MRTLYFYNEFHISKSSAKDKAVENEEGFRGWFGCAVGALGLELEGGDTIGRGGKQGKVGETFHTNLK